MYSFLNFAYFLFLERGKLRQITGPLFPGQQMVLNCSGIITEWRFNGQTVSGASGDTLRITNIDPADNGEYRSVLEVIYLFIF